MLSCTSLQKYAQQHSSPIEKLHRHFLSDRFSIGRFLFVSGLAFLVTAVYTPLALAQLPSFGEGSTDNGTLLPPGINRYGNLEVTWVISPHSGKELFQVAAPAVADRNDLNQMQQSVEVRARNIESLMWVETKRFRERSVARLFNPDLNSDTIHSVEVITATLRNLPVIQVITNSELHPLTIATVTSYDVDFYGQKSDEIAQQWRAALQSEISSIQSLFSPSSLRQRIRETLGIVGGLIILTVVLYTGVWQISVKPVLKPASF